MLFYLALAAISIAIVIFFITGIKHDKKKLKRKAVKAGWLLASMMFLYRYGPLHLIRFLLNIYPFTKSFSNRSFHSQNNRYNFKSVDTKIRTGFFKSVRSYNHATTSNPCSGRITW